MIMVIVNERSYLQNNFNIYNSVHPIMNHDQLIKII